MIPDSASTKYTFKPQRSKILSYARACRSKLSSRPASSRSNEYESFMMNSRTLRRPPRGRGSSRSFVLKWYQTCGSCLYDCSSRAWNVIVSSCENGRTNGRPLRSCSLKTIGIAMRPDVSQSSAGVRTGQSISWPPIASISSRMICTTFWCTRQPSGKYVHRPAPTCRMKPPRTSSWWLAASASAGGSRRVGKKSREARTITVVRADYSSGITAASLAMPLRGRAVHPRGRSIFSSDRLQWNQRGLGQGRGLRHLQTLRAVHALRDPLVDLVEQLVDEDVGRHLLQHSPVRVDEAGVAPPCDAEVRIARLAGTVHRATEHRDLEVLRIRMEPFFHLLRERLHADVVPPARRARNHDRAPLTEAERLEDLPGDADFLHGIGRQRDAHRVADPVHEQRAHADGALDRARVGRSRFGDAQVQRIRHLCGQHPVRPDHGRNVARLDGDLDVAEVEALEQADLLDRGLDEGLCLVLLRELGEMLRERAGVRTDSHRDARGLRGANDLRDLVRAADVARIDAHRGHPLLDRLQGQARVEVDVGDDGDRRQADELRQCLGVLRLRNGDAHDLATCGCESGDLRSRRLDVVRLREGHRLDDDGRAAPDLDPADADLPL